MPFDRCGAISTWHLRLPVEDNAVDPRELTDMILRLRYTAVAGARDEAEARDDAIELPRYKMWSLRRSFPTVWEAFMAAEGTDARSFEIEILRDQFPLLPRGVAPTTVKTTLVLDADLAPSIPDVVFNWTPLTGPLTLTATPGVGGLYAATVGHTSAESIEGGTWTLGVPADTLTALASIMDGEQFDPKKLRDLIFIFETITVVGP